MNKINLKQAIVTYSIITINIIVFILETLAGGSTNTLVAYNFGALYTPDTIYQPWRLFTAMFLHFGIVHIAMNMLALNNLGPIIENIFGKWKYLIIYLFSGLAGNLTVFGVESLTGSYSLSAGASGAIFGILGAYLAITVALSKESRGQFDMKQITTTIIYALAPGFFISGISLSAHIGGLIGGFIISYILILIKRSSINKDFSGNIQ